MKAVEIFDIKFLSQENIKLCDLSNQSIDRVSKVGGDFRQEEIKAKWKSLADSTNGSYELSILKLLVDCSSGTYMRWLCLEVGKLFGTKAFCNRIVRTRVKFLDGK